MSADPALRVIDSHTGGEPTRVVVSGGPDLGEGSLAERGRRLAGEFDWFRSSLVNEPRGNEAMVGALLCEPDEPDCAAAVIYFNNVGVLQGCVHGTIGVAVTLARMGRIWLGPHRIQTLSGVMTVNLQEHGRVTVTNVRSYRHLKDVEVEVPEWGTVRGDVAWGGNWFFLIDGQGPELRYDHIPALRDFGGKVRKALGDAGVTGPKGEEVDHIEVFGPPSDRTTADSRNFVLCPGLEYDRSPCGTGLSAKLACLSADDQLQDGEQWRQASILNTIFEGSVEAQNDGSVLPTITGTAFVTAEAELVIDPDDALRHGIAKGSVQ